MMLSKRFKADTTKTFNENMVESMKTILIPLWSSSGRDFQMVMPIVYFLEKIKHYNVKMISMWDWYVVDIIQPDLILLHDTTGGSINFKFSKYLKYKGYKVLSLVSEGNYVEKRIHQFLWGLNVDEILYEDLRMVWSKRCLNMIEKHYPELKSKLAVSGAVGFDRYKIYHFLSKEYFLHKYRITHFNKIIGYACWGFDIIRTDGELKKIGNKRLKDQIVFFRDYLGTNKYTKYIKTKFKINDVLKEVIENNPDTLFILKLHPGTLDDENTEINDLNYENVLILKYEEDIADIINICDIWMGFDSTTALEAWLLNKPTINLFPLDFEDDRVLNFEGSISVNDYDTLQGYIDEYYSHKTIEDFENKKSNRRDIIEQVIQWDDGLNHVRVGEEIIRMVEQEDKKVKILKDKMPTRIKLYAIHLLKNYSKYFRKINILNNNNFIFYQVSEKDIKTFRNKYYSDFDEFYSNIFK